MSAQVGSGHIAIFPVMKGFKSRVTRDMKSAGAAGSKDFSSSLKGAGRSAGDRLGRDLKSAVNASAGNLGASALKGMNREVAAASGALSKARLKQQDEAGKVRVAEARLAEAVAKSGEGSARAIAAEERLASARRSHKTATDTVTAATTRLKGAQDALKDASSAEATSSWWKRLGQSAANGAQGFLASVRDLGARAGQMLGAAIKGTATATVATAGAGITIALTKGFQRLTGIDTARAKLQGLGHDGKTVGTIMDNATSAVRGTAFGLGEAATVASGAVASGIKPGKQLESVLKGVANVAAATNRTMEETGSIFNNVRANQAAYTQDIKQLANAGLPIWDALQKATGKTQAEVRKMATAGQIDFDLFSKAAADAAGKVAETMGNTIPASMANFWASVGRIGANALGGINKETGEMFGLYAKIAPLIQSMTAALGPVETLAENVGRVLDMKLGPGIEKVTGFFNGLADGSSNVGSKLKEMLPFLAPIGAAFVALGSGGLAGVLSRLPMVGGLLGGLTGPLAALGGPLGIAAAAFAGFALSGADAGALVSGLTGVIDQVIAALPGMVLQVARFVPQLVDSLLAQMPALMNAAFSLINALVGGLVQAIPLLVSGALVLVKGLAKSIIANLPILISGAINIVNALITGIVDALPVLVEGALQIVDGLLAAIISMLPVIIEGGIRLLMALITGIVNALPMIIESALTLVTSLLDAIIANLPMIVAAGIDLLMALIEGIIGALPQIVAAAVTLIIELAGALSMMIPQIIVAGIQLIIALVAGLLEALPMIWNMTGEILLAIWDGLLEVDWASLGMDIVNGIIAGLGSMVGALGDAIKNLASSAWEGFKDFWGIASPSKRMRGAGINLVEGATGGIDSEAGEFSDALTAMARDGSRRAEQAMNVAASTVSISGRGGSADGGTSALAGATFNQTNNFAKEEPEVGAELALRKANELLEGV